MSNLESPNHERNQNNESYIAPPTTQSNSEPPPQRTLKGKSKISERYLQAIRRSSSCEVSLLSSPIQSQEDVKDDISKESNVTLEPTPAITELIAKFNAVPKVDSTIPQRRASSGQLPSKSFDNYKTDLISSEIKFSFNEKHSDHSPSNSLDVDLHPASDRSSQENNLLLNKSIIEVNQEPTSVRKLVSIIEPSSSILSSVINDNDQHLESQQSDPELVVTKSSSMNSFDSQHQDQTTESLHLERERSLTSAQMNLASRHDSNVERVTEETHDDPFDYDSSQEDDYDDEASTSSNHSKLFHHTKSLDERTHGRRLSAPVTIFGRKKSSRDLSETTPPRRGGTIVTPPRSASSVSEYSPSTPPKRDENGMIIPSDELAKYISLYKQQSNSPPPTTRSQSLPIECESPSPPTTSSPLSREEMILKREPFKSFRKLLESAEESREVNSSEG